MTNFTFCLMTCDEVTEVDCIKAVSGELANGSICYQEVRNVTPAYRALNQMITQCNTHYLVPLDADMVLYPGFLERILRVVRCGSDWHSALFPLWDTLTKEKIYALKVFNMDTMGQILYKDDRCPDILHYNDMTAAKLRSIDLYHESPIGDHVVRGPFFCYAKYRDLYMVHRTHPQSIMEHYFKGGSDIKQRALNHYNFFDSQLEETGNQDYEYCIAGMVDGLTSPLDYGSKDLSDRNMRVVDGRVEFESWLTSYKGDCIFL